MDRFGPIADDWLPVGRVQLTILAVALALAAIAPVVLGRFHTTILTSIVLLATFGVAFNLAFGFTNLPSFGHAAFYGLGAYGMAMTLQEFPDAVVLPVVAGVLAAFVFSLIVGALSTRGRGIYFALLTFAFAQFLYEIVIRTPKITGATDGIFVDPPVVLGINLDDSGVIYYVSLIVLILIVAFSYRVITSPFGKVLQAIRYNEDRTEAIGYPVRRVKIVVLALSATLASLPGILYGFSNRFISPDLLFFQTSLDAFLIAIIGGTSTLTGPIAGAAFLVLVRQGVRDLANIGIFLTGVIFIVFIFYLPDGIVGTLQRYLDER